MKNETILKLKEAGASDDMISRLQRYLDCENSKGQQRLLERCRRLQAERLQNDREKLACLDYIIARVEKTGELPQNK